MFTELVDCNKIIKVLAVQIIRQIKIKMTCVHIIRDNQIKLQNIINHHLLSLEKVVPALPRVTI